MRVKRIRVENLRVASAQVGGTPPKGPHSEYRIAVIWKPRARVRAQGKQQRKGET